MIECLEERLNLAGDPIDWFDTSSGDVQISAPNSEEIVEVSTVDINNVRYMTVNGNEHGKNGQKIKASDVTSITVGGGGATEIDLSAVGSGSFTGIIEPILHENSVKEDAPVQISMNGNFDNTINGSQFTDWISGGDGNDTIMDDLGDDWLFGGSGNDTIFGGVDNDYIEGNSGDDVIFGWFGVDFIYGGTGDEPLV